MEETKLAAGNGLWRVTTLSGGEDFVRGNLTHWVEAGLVYIKDDEGDVLYVANAGAFESALLVTED